MELAELTAYARKKYQIEEQPGWNNSSFLSLLCDPKTGHWIALLSCKKDRYSGRLVQHCDLKCGQSCLREYKKSYLSQPVYMKGKKWINIRFSKKTEPEVILRLFDRAMALERPGGASIVLHPKDPLDQKASQGSTLSPKPFYQDTPLPLQKPSPQKSFLQENFYRGLSLSPSPKHGPLPKQLQQLRNLFVYGSYSLQEKAAIFYRQAKFMEEYEDAFPWKGTLLCYFPTYQNLSMEQLRGYFSWRTRIRQQGEYSLIPSSAACLYVYELLNGIGTTSPEDGLEKLKNFQEEYCRFAADTDEMSANLCRWMLDFSIIHGLSPCLAEEFSSRYKKNQDRALEMLRNPQDYFDADIFTSLCWFEGKKLPGSPVITMDPVTGQGLFAQAWRKAAARYSLEGKDLFTLCFGEPCTNNWHPLSHALYYPKDPAEGYSYTLNPCRTYAFHQGSWQVTAYHRFTFCLSFLYGFLHETDLRLRRYFKTGHYLRVKAEEAWATPYVNAVIEEHRQAAAKAARPKITIDLKELEQIRQDASITRNSLLIEEEEKPEAPPVPPASVKPSPKEVPGLSVLQADILQALLRGEEVGDILQAHRLMPSLAADAINESLFEKIGDTVLLCENDTLSLVEEYREELLQLLEGKL